MNVFAWYVDNPFGRCTSARVAAFGVTRRDATRKIKVHGLRVDCRTTARFAELDDQDLAQINRGPQTVWIMDARPGHPWMTAAEFRDGTTSLLAEPD